MILNYKYRLYPNKSQEQKLIQMGGNARFIWNYFRDLEIKQYEKDKTFIWFYDLSMLLPAMKKKYPWLNLSYAQSLQSVARHMDRALKDLKRGKGFPRSKIKCSLTDSICFPQYIILQGTKRVRIPKVGDIKIKLHRDLPKYTSVTIIQQGNKWWASFVVEQKEQEKIIPETSIGIDLGINSFATDSNGNKYEKENNTKNHAYNLKKKQQNLSRKEYGSKNYLKALIQVINIHLRIRDQRKDFLHKLSNQITNDYDLICVENLSVKNMVRNKNLSKSISDQGWGSFLAMLLYKAQLKGKEVIKIGRFDASSKTCSCCGHVQDIPLQNRTYECPICGLELDRDINAAINIHKWGIEEYTAGTAGIEACGDTSAGDILLDNRSRYVPLKQEAVTFLTYGSSLPKHGIIVI